jgi:hypothetical protein
MILHTSVCVRRFLPLSTLLLALLLSACAAKPLRPEAERLAPFVTAPVAAAGVRDLRPAFRSALCAELASDAAHPCEKVLTRMGGEAPGDGRPFPSAADVARKYRIAFVPGFFAECLEDDARPFAAAAVELRSRGFEVVYLPVTGRGSVATNAELLAQEIAALPDDPRPLLVFAYSKGLPDVLDFAVRHPEASRRIAAVVGMAGAVNGSPLADRYEDLWRATMMSLSIGKCSAGSGEGVHDLRRDVRMAWWAAHRAEVHLPVYSLVALPDRDRVSPSLTAAHVQLEDVDARNDGQVIWTDAVAAPGALLGYVNADHWAMAMKLSQAFPALASQFVDDVPRGALLQAAIFVVARDLAASM